MPSRFQIFSRSPRSSPKSQILPRNPGYSPEVPDIVSKLVPRTTDTGTYPHIALPAGCITRIALAGISHSFPLFATRQPFFLNQESQPSGPDSENGVCPVPVLVPKHKRSSLVACASGEQVLHCGPSSSFCCRAGKGGWASDSAYKQVQLAREFEAGSVPVNL